MTVSLEQAQARLAELIAQSARGESVIITGSDSHPLARIVAVSNGQTPKFGFAKGRLRIVADDDEHLRDFGGYMPGEKQ